MHKRYLLTIIIVVTVIFFSACSVELSNIVDSTFPTETVMLREPYIIHKTGASIYYKSFDHYIGCMLEPDKEILESYREDIIEEYNFMIKKIVQHGYVHIPTLRARWEIYDTPDTYGIEANVKALYNKSWIKYSIKSDTVDSKFVDVSISYLSDEELALANGNCSNLFKYIAPDKPDKDNYSLYRGYESVIEDEIKLFDGTVVNAVVSKYIIENTFDFEIQPKQMSTKGYTYTQYYHIIEFIYDDMLVRISKFPYSSSYEEFFSTLGFSWFAVCKIHE